MNDKAREIEKELNPIIKQIILDLRPAKKMDERLFADLHNRLEAYKVCLRGCDTLPRSMAGKLFYLFSTMIVEAKHADYDQRIVDEIMRLRLMLLDIFDETMLN